MRTPNFFYRVGVDVPGPSEPAKELEYGGLQRFLWGLSGWVVGGVHKMGGEGDGSLYFVTICLFACVRATQMGRVFTRCTLVICVSVCSCATWLWSLNAGHCFGSDFGWRGSCGVAGYSFSEDVHADRHCDPRDARLAVRLCTTDGALADCVEPNHQNQGGLKSQCGRYPGERRVRG